MYFTSGSDRAFEQLMQGKPGFDHYDSGEAVTPEDCGTCRFYRPHWKYQFCVYAECPYQPGKLTAYDAVTFRVKGVENMAVFRVERNKGYTVMSNHHLRNKDLSLKAKGLLSQMLSLPEDWDYKSNRFMPEIVSSIDTFGIPSKEKGHSVKQPGDVELLHSKGYNDQEIGYLSRDMVKKNKDLIDKYKVKISIMVPQGGEVGIKPENGYRSISTPQIVPPGQVDSFSYLNIGFFDTEAEAKGLISYVSCKFVRFLLRSTYSSVHVSKDNFRFVPLVDFKKTWTDEKLYEYYELSPEQITLIEDTMRPMVLEGGDE